jgi:hypothetical protein
MLEPLLQWLQAGNDGYMPTPSPCCHGVGAPEQATNAAFADDLALISGSLRGMRNHFRKVELFCAWTGMKVNMKKTAGTCLEHKPQSVPACDRWRATVTYNDQPVSFFKKDETYRYLGVELRLDLCGVDNLRKLKAKIEERAVLLRNSLLRIQKRRLALHHHRAHPAGPVRLRNGAVRKIPHRHAARRDPQSMQACERAALQHRKRNAHARTEIQRHRRA